MIISVNWLKKFTSINESVDELATRIGARLVEIEDVTELGEKYRDVIVAKVIECAPLEGSDHLNVAKIDDGRVAIDVERDERGLVQVVCGAPNVREGLVVAWLPPRSVVPETYGSNDPFTLDARKLRGVMSSGMLASAKELDLFDDHEGILELEATLLPGTKFAEAYEINDVLLDIENKSLTHRPDTFGVIGFAREVAAIQGQQFETPDWLTASPVVYPDQVGDIEAPTVTIEDPELSDKYAAVVLTNVSASTKSPLAMQTYLARVGVRPLNAVVDVTNYLMMLTGQPLHAFDYDKLIALAGGKADIRIRAGRAGETLTLLDGKVIELTGEDIVIASGEVPVALAGAMGGADTEVDESTSRIVIESATFNLYKLRNTQMRHGIFSEAITRFTKGQPSGLVEPVLAEAIRMLTELSGAQRASDVTVSVAASHDDQSIELSTAKVNSLLGTSYTKDEIVATLSHVEIAATESADPDMISVTPPYWRTDLHIPEDLVEEIGRLNGFDVIVPTLPLRNFTAAKIDEFDALRATLRQSMLRAGANEVLTYSFVHGDVLQRADLDPKKSYRITNSISPDLQYYRQSLTPSLLGLVHSNIKAGFDEFALFELNKVHSKSSKLVDDRVPAEMHRLAMVVARRKAAAGAPYYQAKKMVEYLAQTLGLRLTFVPLAENMTMALARPFEYRRSARVIDVASGQSLGIVGEYKKSVSRNFKLPEYAAGFELLPEAIALALPHRTAAYSPLSRFPSAERDICFQVSEEVMYAQIIDAASLALKEIELEWDISPLDIYQSEGAEVKNITLRLKLTSHERTLAGEDVAEIVAKLVHEVADATGATVV